MERLELFRGFGSKVNEGGHCNPMGGCSTNTGARESTVIAGKSRLTGVLAGENAARVSRAPSEADIAVEMCWASCTSYNTARRAIPLEGL